MTDKTTAERDAAQFTACDMATASAQGFRDGRASLPLPGAQEAIAWRHRMGPTDTWVDCSKEFHDWVLRAPDEWPGNEVQALCVAAPQPALSAGWRDISTVPKDGTEIILRRGIRVGAAAWCHWPATEFHEAGAGWSIGFDGDSWDDEKAPSHWQPMPAPPLASEAKGDGNG